MVAAATVDDAQISVNANQALGTLPNFPHKNIKVEVAAGKLTVSGIVEHAADAQRAYRVIRRIAGVRSIDNRLVTGELLGWD